MSCRHDWIDTGRMLPAGGLRALCTRCGTTFPCRAQPCDHVDCRLASGNPEPPPGVEYPPEPDCSSSVGVSDARPQG